MLCIGIIREKKTPATRRKCDKCLFCPVSWRMSEWESNRAEESWVIMVGLSLRKCWRVAVQGLRSLGPHPREYRVRGSPNR